ncbi:MAG: helix-turn-helix transcriptional regulator, partial [Ruminococcus sp.]|nr:helix-turn-helix transcriptional regulator [Ruminococcus sp.]
MGNSITGLDFKIQEMAARIKELREVMGYTYVEMAQKTGVSVEEYMRCEEGRSDLNFAFIYRCALAFNVDVTDIIQGTSPTLASYTVTRKGEGQRIEHAHGMTYYNLASSFKNRIAEPLYVHSVRTEHDENEDIELTTHEGQECDIVIKGTLKVQVGEHIEILQEGDSIYYDSSSPHGMAAIGDEDCLFYAIVLNPSGEPIPEFSAQKAETAVSPKRIGEAKTDRVYRKWVAVQKNENGTPVKV